MSIRDALYDLVHDYPGGAPALAPRMKLAVSTLSSMANPNCDTHGWRIERVAQAMGLTGDLRPLEALCQQFGGVFVSIGRFDAMPPGRLLKEAQHLCKEFGDVPVRLAQVLEDGRITPSEAEAVRREVYDLQQAAAALCRVVDEICAKHLVIPEDDRPG